MTMQSEKQVNELAPASAFTPRMAVRRPDEEPRRSLNIVTSLRRHRTLVLSTLATCLLLSAVVFAFHRKPLYESKSYVYVSPTFPTTLAEEKEQDRPYDAYIQDQAQTVTRYDILATAVESLHNSGWQRPGESLQAAVSRLSKRLVVERVGSTFQLSIALSSSDPQLAAAAVKAVTNAYVEKAHHEEFYGRDERIRNLRDERVRLQTELDQKMGEQARLMQSLGVASVATQDSGTSYDARLLKLHEDLTAAREARLQAEAQLAALRTGANGTPAIHAAAQDAMATDAGLSSLKSSLNQRRAVLVEQMNGLTAGNPLYKQDAQELAGIDRELERFSADLEGKAAGRIEQRLDAEVFRTRMVEVRLNQDLLTQTHAATSAAPKFQQARELGHTIDQLQTSYAAVDERIRNLDLESNSPGSIHLSSPALAPLTPKQSRTWMLALLMLGVSLLLSAGAGIVADLFDPHVYTSADVEQVVGFAPIGALLDHDGYSQEASAQYLLRMASGIRHARTAAGARTFLFTGTVPESGTTTIVEKLGRQLRNLNLTTLTLAATSVDGKVTYVTSSSSATRTQSTQAVSYTPSSSHILSSGNSGSGAAGTLAVKVTATGVTPGTSVHGAALVTQILDEVRDQYDVVLIDASPLLISADTEYLARIADGTILVAQSGRTTRNQLRRAAQVLERLNVPGVSVALNRIERKHVDAALASDIEDFQRQLSRQRPFPMAGAPKQSGGDAGAESLGMHFTQRERAVGRAAVSMEM
ncbi:MAG: GumC family protein [Acidobacteriaceae bacterium]